MLDTAAAVPSTLGDVDVEFGEQVAVVSLTPTSASASLLIWLLVLALGRNGFMSPIGSFQRRRSCWANGKTGAELLLNISSMGDQPLASPISALGLQALTLPSPMAVVCCE